VAAERVLVDKGRDERFDGRPDSIEHFGVERAHDGGDLHWSLVVGQAPRLSRGHTDDRWMVYLREKVLVRDPFAYPRGLLESFS